MKYAGIIRNDLAAAPSISVSFFTQGCPHHCKGCHNPETWDFDGGKEFTHETLNEIYNAIEANGVERSFCIMGGEPMCEQNLLLVYMVLQNVKERYPNIKTYLWTGYYYEDLLKMTNPKVGLILEMLDVIVDGPFVENQKDLTLKMRGSANQSIIDLAEKRKLEKI